MRDDLSRIEYSGAAAVDYAYLNAQPGRVPVELPEERVERKQGKKQGTRERIHVGIAPTAVLGFFAVLSMLILVIFGYVRLYEATTENARLADELADMKAQNAILAKQYEGSVDLSYIEDMAINELGMQKVLPEQIVYVNLSHATDKGVVITAQKEKGFIGRAIESIVSSVRELKEYLS
ncbi:MAG: hypothetical protein IKE00_01065 [Oscillospiraceae bacterium]|nr:hypothetical protein [Oscillospiraceae bacterium]